MIRPSIDTVFGLIRNLAKTRTKGFANFSDAFLSIFQAFKFSEYGSVTISPEKAFISTIVLNLGGDSWE